MKRFLSILVVLVITVGLCRAAFSATGGINGSPYEFIPPTATGLDNVFVFNGIQNSRLIFTDDNPSDWTWYRYAQDPSAAEAVPVGQIEVSASQTVVTDLQTGYGYCVRSTGGTSHYAYIVAWIPIGYASISFLDEGDLCSEVILKVAASGTDMYYYTASGLRRALDRQHTLTWNTHEWDETADVYVIESMSKTFNGTEGASGTNSNWACEAPLTNTVFTVTGDQFSGWFGTMESLNSDLYEAVAVKASPVTVVETRTTENELDKSTGELTGSAPMEATFYSNPSDAVTLVEWYLYKPSDGEDSYTRYTDQDFNYTFKESGQYTVKLYVSNPTCMDSAEFTPEISESMLDCPNFFTPRSSPGENDEFRVAYRSLISFKGVIVNRWGNILFEWTDPATGWNGTYKGKAVNPGVYFYLIEAVGSDGIDYKKRGDINLLE